MSVSDPGCPLEVSDVKVPKGDPTFDPKETDSVFLPFTRAKYDRSTGLGPNNPRIQVNDVTSWIDGSVLYGTNEAWLTMMRSFENGTLSEGNDGRGFPPKDQHGMYCKSVRVNILLEAFHNYRDEKFVISHNGIKSRLL